jgi:SPP1 gp7 family putative phage head morphogenesis protein
MNCSIARSYRLRDWIATDAIGTKSLNLNSREAKLAYWRAYERQREAFYGWARKQIAKQFKSELADVLRQMNGDEVELSHLNDAIARQRAAWRKLLESIWLRVGQEFGKRTEQALLPEKSSAGIETKSVEDVWFAAVRDYIRSKVGERVVQILATTKDLIKEQIREGIEAGEGVYQLRKRIDALYLDEIIPHRSEVIARTEVVGASNAASREAARATGLELTHEWVATADDRVRPSHEDASGQIVPLDEPFIVGGEEMMFPGDPAGGDEAINCRCVEVYATAR